MAKAANVYIIDMENLEHIVIQNPSYMYLRFGPI